ncbi:hypothetical protein R3P38DRAFT_3224298 [Favolaschia claudopus]|uniref:DUF6535 domain-containing protein n=1 Tax=Favolaschia claudopus TaxID=2862362 RepID=A0AAV9ZX10_9AGAR
MERRDASLEDDDAAGAKIWSVYASEAEKYDKALVQSWKSDMDGLLIFAGLFSAILTAFLIESYKTLTPDSEDDMVLLLSQISAQLAGIANGSAIDIPTPAPFVTPASSLVCNLLWFISLGLSLACALTATLVEQWARDFTYKTEMRSSPLTRARIFSYLYYGLKRFNMHAVVEAIPLLLHLSLVFFFAGLIAFLVPVNRGVMILSVLLLATLLAVYATFTVFPVLAYDSPYHTPLSGIVWRSVQLFDDLRKAVRRQVRVSSFPPKRDSMMENMTKVAVHDSEERRDRDLRALCWSVKSLADDYELEPFLEGIPDVLWSSKGRRNAYDDHIVNLLHDPEVQLKQRLENFLRGCNSDLLPRETQFRRLITALKALWAIATIPAYIAREQLEHLGSFEPTLVKQPGLPFKVEQYQVSARAVLYLNALLPLFVKYNDVDKIIDQVQHAISRAPQQLLLNHVQSLATKFRKLRADLNYFGNVLSGLSIRNRFSFLEQSLPKNVSATSEWIAHSLKAMKALCSILLEVKYRVFAAFLMEAAFLESPPYEFEATRAVFLFDSPPVPTDALIDAFSTIVEHQVQKDSFNKHTHGILADLLATSSKNCRKFPPHLSTYLITQNLSDLIVLKKCDNSWLCECLTMELKVNFGSSSTNYFDNSRAKSSRRVVEVIWELAFSAEHHCRCLWKDQKHQDRFPPESQETLDCVRGAMESSATPSAVALIQTQSLNAVVGRPNLTMTPVYMEEPEEVFIDSSSEEDEILDEIRFPAHPFLAKSLPVYRQLEDDVYAALDLRIAVVAEFLQGCGSTIGRYDEPPYKAEDTMRILTRFVPRSAPVKIQRHFAAAWRAGMEELAGTNLQATLAEVLVDSRLLSMYRDEEEEGDFVGYYWLKDPSAFRMFIEGMKFVEQRDDIGSGFKTKIETIRNSMTSQQTTHEENVEDSG